MKYDIKINFAPMLISSSSHLCFDYTMILFNSPLPPPTLSTQNILIKSEWKFYGHGYVCPPGAFLAIDMKHKVSNFMSSSHDVESYTVFPGFRWRFYSNSNDYLSRIPFLSFFFLFSSIQFRVFFQGLFTQF